MLWELSIHGFKLKMYQNRGGVKKKMARASKPTEWAERIRELLEAAGLSQAELASKLESDSSQGTASQGTVSNWLRADGNYAPSSRMFAQLGNIAVEHGFDPLWFWEQAGFDCRAAIALTERMLKKMHKRAAPGEIVELPVLSIDEVASGREAKIETGEVFRFSADRVVNRASTVALRVDQGAEGFPFAAGDIVVVDRSSIDLQSLWNKVVLVHLDPSAAPTSIGVREWRRGPCMGLLSFSQLAWDRYLWGAALGPLGSFKHEPVVIGYKHSQAGKDFYRDHLEWKLRRVREEKGLELRHPDDPEPSEERLHERECEAARAKIQPTDGCIVLGRMIAWFSAESGEAKR
jgi:transcriptional regulator with XRE-family HTH domain